MTPSRLFAIAFVCILHSACVSLPTEQAATDSFVQNQKATARTLQEQDRLAESLSMWRSLLPLGPPDPETANAIKTLEGEIQQRVNANLRKAKKSYARHQRRAGDTFMLRVLVLSPGHPQALEQLSRSNSARVSEQQESKTSEEYRVAAKRKREAPGSTYQNLLTLHQRQDYAAMLAMPGIQDATEPEVSSLLRSAHLQLADQAEAVGDLDGALAHVQSAMAIEQGEGVSLEGRELALRKNLGLYWYQKGSALITTDLDQAIAALQKSVTYNPSDTNARRKLMQAQTMQRNLRKIESRP